jgi:hypothetical protein
VKTPFQVEQSFEVNTEQMKRSSVLMSSLVQENCFPRSEMVSDIPSKDGTEVDAKTFEVGTKRSTAGSRRRL